MDGRDELYLTRLGRTRDAMTAAGLDVLLVTDPVNIQYATGATNMSVFTARTPA